jgi:hypothetical protein
MRTSGVALVLWAAAVTATGCGGRPGCDADAGLIECTSGSCSDLMTSNLHCGSCGVRCDAAEECVLGECVCRQGATRCGGLCTTMERDPENCGDCGTVCEQPEPDCRNGQCTCNRQYCFPYCVDLLDHENCEECGRACAPDEYCLGHCLGPGCPPDVCMAGDGQGCEPTCDGAAGELCCRTSTGVRCANILTDREHCGGCGRECLCGGEPCGCRDGECPVF